MRAQCKLIVFLTLDWLAQGVIAGPQPHIPHCRHTAALMHVVRLMGLQLTGFCGLGRGTSAKRTLRATSELPLSRCFMLSMSRMSYAASICSGRTHAGGNEPSEQRWPRNPSCAVLLDVQRLVHHRVVPLRRDQFEGLQQGSAHCWMPMRHARIALHRAAADGYAQTAPTRSNAQKHHCGQQVSRFGRRAVAAGLHLPWIHTCLYCARCHQDEAASAKPKQSQRNPGAQKWSQQIRRCRAADPEHERQQPCAAAQAAFVDPGTCAHLDQLLRVLLPLRQLVFRGHDAVEGHFGLQAQNLKRFLPRHPAPPSSSSCPSVEAQGTGTTRGTPGRSQPWWRPCREDTCSRNLSGCKCRYGAAVAHCFQNAFGSAARTGQIDIAAQRCTPSTNGNTSIIAFPCNSASSADIIGALPADTTNCQGHAISFACQQGCAHAKRVRTLMHACRNAHPEASVSGPSFGLARAATSPRQLSLATCSEGGSRGAGE